jgi:hypothetical protein
MKILHLINDTYQVVSEDETTVYFQGSQVECEIFIESENFKPHLFFINLF